MIRAKTLQDLFKRYRRPGDLVFAVAFLVFSLFLAINLGDQAKWSSGRLLAQPAFWPHLAVWMMVGFGVLHLIGSLVSPKLAGRWVEVAFWVRSLEFAGWFLGYVLLVPRLGYLPSTLVFMTVLAFRLGYRRPVLLVGSAGVGLCIVLIFKTFLQVKVPGGQIYELLPDALRSFMLTNF
ncbi:MAG: tripartite tricarboxylate transporter TctB family protein [Rhodobacteraceae bacterium]|nr:tripartite tricarboxylate transporter TctB family protein [Paracoccaceae bacterium]